MQQPGSSVVVVVLVVVMTQSSGSPPDTNSQPRRSQSSRLSKPRHLAWFLKLVPLQQPGSGVVVVVVGHTIEQSMYSFIGSNVQRATPLLSVSIRHSRSVLKLMHV